MNESWGVVPQNFNAAPSWPDSRSSNFQTENNWDRQHSSANWGSDRPSAPTTSENTLGVKRTAPGSWGQNRSENSPWPTRNEPIQNDGQSLQARRFSHDKEISRSPPGYKKFNSQHDEDENAVVQQSFESLKNDDFERHQQQIELEEDGWNPNYRTVPTNSRLHNTPYEDEMPYNTPSVHKSKDRVEPPTPPNLAFQVPRKEFRNVEVQTDQIDLSLIIASNQKLLSCTIGSRVNNEYQQTAQNMNRSVNNSTSEQRYPPQQISLLDADPEEYTKVENVSSSWNTSSDLRGSSIKHDTNSRDEWSVNPKPGSDSWGNKLTSIQNDSWNTISQQKPARNDIRDTVPPPGSAPQTSARNDTRGTVPPPIPVQSGSWDSTSTPQKSTRNDDWSTLPQPNSDSWDSAPQTSSRNDNRESAPKQVPVQSESWESAPLNDNRESAPKQVPAQPDSWDNRGTSGSQQMPMPNSWNTIQSVPPQVDSWSVQKSRPKEESQSDRQLNVSNDDWNQRSNNPDDLSKEPRTSEPPKNQWGAATNQSVQQTGGALGANKDDKLVSQSQNVGDSWGAESSASDWTKQAELFAKELGQTSAIKESQWGQTSNEHRVEDSYGTGTNDSYYDNSSSKNRFDGSRKSCHKCGKEGHIARDCMEEGGRGGYGSRNCHKCGKEGHIARDCTEEGGRGGYGNRSCHKCGKEGHIARDCMEETGRGGYSEEGGRGGYGVKSCHKCGKEGHIARDCMEDAYETTGEVGNYSGGPRSRTKLSPFSNPEPSNHTSEEAWANLIRVDGEKDADDFQEALELYAKVTPHETFQSIEKRLRDEHCNGKIIALEREEIPLTKVLIDLQGNVDKKYVARVIMGDPVRLARTAGKRASTDEENYEWLAESGFMVDDLSPVCFNCKKKGHNSKDCTEPKREVEKQPPLTCQNCHSSDHQTKYCKEERRDYYVEARDRKVAGSYNNEASFGYDGDDRNSYRGNQVCYNCNGEGHTSRDCQEPRRGGGGKKCYKCGEEGHMSKDCTSGAGGEYDRGNYNSDGWQRESSSRNNDRTGSWNTRDISNDNNLNRGRNDSNISGPQEQTWNKSSNGGNASHEKSGRNDNSNLQESNSWNKSGGGESSRGDFSSVQNKDSNNLPTQSYKVESDSWDAKPQTENAGGQNEWGYKTAEDFGWDKKTSVQAENKQDRSSEIRERTSAPDYENRRDRSNDPRGRTSDYENGRSYRNDPRDRSNDFNNRRNDYQRDRPNDYDNRRNNYQRERSNDYDNRRNDYQRERSNNDYDNRRNNYQRERSNDYDNRRNDYQRERSNDYDSRRNDYQRERSNDYDNRRNDYQREKSNDYDNRRNNYQRNDYDNRRNDYQRERTNEYGNRRSYYPNERSNDYENNRGRGSDARSNDYENNRGRGSDARSSAHDDYGRNEPKERKSANLGDQPWW